MPYTFSIYPNETIPIPKVGDIFIVTKIEDNVFDLHWGRCTFIELQKIVEKTNENN